MQGMNGHDFGHQLDQVLHVQERTWHTAERQARSLERISDRLEDLPERIAWELRQSQPASPPPTQQPASPSPSRLTWGQWLQLALAAVVMVAALTERLPWDTAANILKALRGG